MSASGVSGLDELLESLALTLPELSEAIGRVFPLRALTPERVSPLSDKIDDPRLLTPGFIAKIELPDSIVLVAFPECPWIGSWYKNTDPTSRSKLSTLAVELGMILFPDTCDPEKCTYQTADKLAELLSGALRNEQSKFLRFAVDWGGSPPGEFFLLGPFANKPLEGTPPRGEKSAVAGLDQSATFARESLEPASRQQGAAGIADSVRGFDSGETRTSTDAPTPVPSADLRSAKGSTSRRITPADLPAYAKNLLHIELPVTVMLARRRQPLGTVLRISSGAILQFEKSCEEALELEVAGRVIALGEAVKVGDKFGLRITSMVPPPERLKSLRPKAGSHPANTEASQSVKPATANVSR